MEIKDLTCKNCGASLKVDDYAKEVTCQYCNATFSIKTEEDKGYEFEKGRMKAREEKMRENMDRLQKEADEGFKRIQSSMSVDQKVVKIIFYVIFGMVASGIAFTVISMIISMLAFSSFIH